jgi:hypothetical protein
MRREYESEREAEQKNHPDPIIIGISALLTAVAVWKSVRVASANATRTEMREPSAVRAPAAA